MQEVNPYDVQEVNPYVRPGDRCHDAIQDCIRVALALIRSTQGFKAVFGLGKITFDSLNQKAGALVASLSRCVFGHDSLLTS